MRVVLDSNVYVSAFVLPGGAASQLMAALLRGRAEPLISRPIMAEVLGVLGRKFAADREQLARTALFLSGFAEQVVPRERLHVLSDEPDNRILECAVARPCSMDRDRGPPDAETRTLRGRPDRHGSSDARVRRRFV